MIINSLRIINTRYVLSDILRVFIYQLHSFCCGFCLLLYNFQKLKDAIYNIPPDLLAEMMADRLSTSQNIPVCISSGIV